jgi:adhesin transport system outer membrane protein
MNSKQRGKHSFLACTALVAAMQLLPAANAQAQSGENIRDAASAPAPLIDAVKKAVGDNPEVQARWHGYRAATEEQDVARGGYYPQIDVAAGAGREWLKRPGASAERFNYRGATLSLNQMLYDGFATSSEVARMGFARLVRYYELLDASETSALEVVRAYADVERYREHLRQAKSNYVEHKQIYDQINDRVKAGVSRRVDLEQAAGRLALAESNLLTEVSNLHDVSARYVRLVGDTPGEDLPPLGENLFGGAALPSNVTEALKTAFAVNPAFNAAIENVRSTEALRDRVRAANHPRLDLRASRYLGRNADGYDGKSRDDKIELALSWNLFRGGSDQARIRQAGEEVNQARDLREKACRDLRQTLTIAYADTRRIAEQLGYLDQHQLAIAKAREAYRRQFDIGQRTLLDLLDTENEYFDARRAYTNAHYDLVTARARTLAGMGQLLRALDIVREDLPAARDAGQDRDTVDPADQCPAEAPVALEIDKDKLISDTLREQGR